MNVFQKIASAKTDNINEFGFDVFADVCMAIAKVAQTMCEVDESPLDKYGFGSVFFMTDKFGGVYCNFIFDDAERRVYDRYKSKDQVEIRTWGELAKRIGEQKRHMESVRDLDALADFINSQNED